MFVAFTVYFTLRTFADISWPSSSDPSLLHVATGFLVYLDHFFFPTLLLPATHVLWPSSMELIGGGIGLFILLIITLKTQENNTRIWGLSLFFAGLIPAFSAIAQTGLTADRYLYIPMLGLSLLMANQLEQISSYVHARMKKHIFGWAAGLIITVYTIQSIRILPNWNDNLRLFSKSAEVHSSPYQAGALAKALEEEGQLDDAAYWYEQAIQPPIPYQHSCYNITWIHLLRRDMLKIVSTGERALQAGCTPSAELLAPLALGYAYAGNWKQAELLTKNSTRDPRNIFFLVSVTLKARARDIAAFDELRYQSAIPDAIKILQQSDQETVQWLEDLISK
jgi:tetratricopeptide (TPR) repeat protein